VLAAMEQALGTIPRSKLLRLDGGGDRAKSRDVMASALSTHSRSRRLLIAATSDESALGALEVVRASGLASSSAIVGHDGSEEALQALGERNSPFIGTVSFFSEDYGRQLIQLFARILRGDAIPPFVYVPHRLVTRQNLRRFSASVPGRTASAAETDRQALPHSSPRE
jgi:ribose transport system substrate-binding protein